MSVLLLVLLPAGLAGQARTDEADEVRRAVLDYVEGFYEGDTAKMVRSIHPDVQKYGFFIPRDSTGYQGARMVWTDFLAYANRVKASKRFAASDAPKEVTLFEVLDQTATARLTAYWGVDYLLLAKYDGKWMITHVLWQTPPKH